MARTLDRLHLLDASCPLFGWPVLRALRAAGEPVAILGSERLGEQAAERTPGLDVVACVSAPTWSARSGALALRRGLRGAGVEVGCAIAWSERARSVAAHAMSCIGEVIAIPDHLLSPPAVPDAERHEAGITRAELGIGENETLLVALGGASGSVDAFAFAYLAGVLSLAGVPLVTLVPTSAVSLDRALRFVERHDHAWRSIVADYELPQVLGIADLVAYLPPERPEELAERAAVQLRSELGWVGSRGIAAVLRTDRVVTEAVGDLIAEYPRVICVEAGEPGLKAVRAIERALALGRGGSVDTAADFERWSAAVRSLGAGVTAR